MHACTINICVHKKNNQAIEKRGGVIFFSNFVVYVISNLSFRARPQWGKPPAHSPPHSSQSCSSTFPAVDTADADVDNGGGSCCFRGH